MNSLDDFFSLKARVILLEKKLQNSYCNNYKIRKKLDEVKKREITKVSIAKILIILKRRWLLDMNYKAIARECDLTSKTVWDISYKMNKENEIKGE